MVRFEQDWCDALAALAGHSLDIMGGELLQVLYVVTDTDEGKAAFHLSDDGSSMNVIPGKLARGVKPNITVTVKESVLLDLWAGGSSRDRAFMAGDIKIEGAYELWIDQLVPAFEQAPWLDAWAAAV